MNDILEENIKFNEPWLETVREIYDNYGSEITPWECDFCDNVAHDSKYSRGIKRLTSKQVGIIQRMTQEYL